MTLTMRQVAIGELLQIRHCRSAAGLRPCLHIYDIATMVDATFYIVSRLPLILLKFGR